MTTQSTPQSEPHWMGWFLAVSASLSTTLVIPLVRGSVVGGLSPTIMLLLRLIITVVLLAGTIALTNPQLFKIDRRGAIAVTLIGIISGVEICTFFWSLAYMDGSMVAMLKSVQPLAVLLLLTLRGESLTRRHLVRVALAIGGIYLLVGPGGQVAAMGLILIVASVVLYALQLVLTQWYLIAYDFRTITFYMLTMMMLVVFGWWWVEEMPWQDPGASGWLAIAVLALVSTYFARMALFSAVRLIGSGQVALLWPLQTLGSIVLSVLFLQEQLTLVQWVGGMFILTSAFLAIERNKKVVNR
ncbi:MAG: DMT family transporter [Chloroflexota bacterium]